MYVPNMYICVPWPITKGNDWAHKFQKMKISKENDFYFFIFLPNFQIQKLEGKKKNQTLISTLFKKG
jgi:hypothetical protein